MKAIHNAKRAAALGLSALALSSVMLCGVSCTRGNHNTPSDTTDNANGNQNGGKPSVTTPATDQNDGTGTTSDKPLDPDAGTVKPNDNAGDPPAGTEGEGSRSILPRFMK